MIRETVNDTMDRRKTDLHQIVKIESKIGQMEVQIDHLAGKVDSILNKIDTIGNMVIELRIGFAERNAQLDSVSQAVASMKVDRAKNKEEDKETSADETKELMAIFKKMKVYMYIVLSILVTLSGLSLIAKDTGINILRLFSLTATGH